MKKLLFISLLSLFLVAGCGKNKEYIEKVQNFKIEEGLSKITGTTNFKETMENIIKAESADPDLKDKDIKWKVESVKDNIIDMRVNGGGITVKLKVENLGDHLTTKYDDIIIITPEGTKGFASHYMGETLKKVQKNIKDILNF